MLKRKTTLLLILGIGLIAISLCFILAGLIRSHVGNRNCQKVVARMEEILPERAPGTPGLYPDTGMPTLEIDGVDYVAMLEIPSAGVKLPIANDWNASKLFRSPALFSGSAYNHALIIGGADQSKQFGFCSQIDQGALVTVTDMTGAQFTYRVSRVDRGKHADVQWLSGADLTLFCRDSFSMNYIAVRCVYAYG